MISWEKYLTSVVDTFREYFGELTEEEKSEAQMNLTFIEPCQIEVFSFIKPRRDMLLVSFNLKRPDKEFVIHDKIKLNSKEYILKQAQSDVVFQEHSDMFIDATKSEFVPLAWTYLQKDLSVYFFKNLREEIPNPKNFARECFEGERRSIRERLRRKTRLLHYDRLGNEVESLREQLEQISDIRLRSNAISATEEISSRLSEVKRIEEHEKRIDTIEKDIGSMRRVVGVSKEFQDWRLLMSDVEYLKETHTEKGTFKANIKRLDEKIENGFKALNTRIEDLKAIKFWSKRTLLEIALGIWGAIVTLYVAGVIKF